jgi:type I restriction enzyme S subunit
VAIGELVTIAGGGTPQRSNPDYFDGAIPWVTPKDMKAPELRDSSVRLTQRGLQESATKLVPADSVLVVVRSGVLKHSLPIAINRVPVALNQDMKALIAGPGLQPEYLAHYLRSITPEILRWVRATTADNFPVQRLRDLQLPLPPLVEQRRIADILDLADAVRGKRRQAIAHLDMLMQSIFVDMFGDPAKDGTEDQTVALISVCRRLTDGTHQPPAWASEGIPFLFVSNIVGGSISFDTQKFISESTWRALMSRCPIERGDVLYSTVGSYGVPVTVDTDRPFAFQRHIAHLKPDLDEVEPSFLRSMLASAYVRRQADRAARGVAQKTVNLGDIAKFLVLVPPLNRQREFAKRAGVVEDLRAMAHKSLTSLDALYLCLQHRAFGGEL